MQLTLASGPTPPRQRIGWARGGLCLQQWEMGTRLRSHTIAVRIAWPCRLPGRSSLEAATSGGCRQGVLVEGFFTDADQSTVFVEVVSMNIKVSVDESEQFNFVYRINEI